MKTNWIKLVASQAGEVHDFSCLMVDIPKDIKTRILEWNLKNIPEADLFKEDKSGKGRELTPHVTVKYGLHTDDPVAVFEKIINKPLDFTLGLVSRFTSGKNYDVILVEILSPELHSLNGTISSDFACTDTFPDYKPHLTLAYVNKGSLTNLDNDKSFAETRGQFDTFLFTNPQNDMFTKVVKTENEGMTGQSAPGYNTMGTKNREEFVWMEKKGDKVKIFASGLVFLHVGGRIHNESYPCLMSAIREYEKHGFTVVGEVSEKAPMGEAGYVEVYPYTKEFHDSLEVSGFDQVGPWENNWAWKYIALKSHMFAIGLNPTDATKGLEMEITKTPKFKVGETISLGKDNQCLAYDVEDSYSGDILVDVDTEIKVDDVKDNEYVLDFGYFEDIYLQPSDPESKSVRVRYLTKAIENVDASAAYVEGQTSTLPFKEMK